MSETIAVWRVMLAEELCWVHVGWYFSADYSGALMIVKSGTRVCGG